LRSGMSRTSRLCRCTCESGQGDGQGAALWVPRGSQARTQQACQPGSCSTTCCEAAALTLLLLVCAVPALHGCISAVTFGQRTMQTMPGSNSRCAETEDPCALPTAGWCTDWIARPAAPWWWPALPPQPPGCRRPSAGVQRQQGAAAAAAEAASLTTLSTVEAVESRRVMLGRHRSHQCSGSTGRWWSAAAARLCSRLASLRSLSRCNQLPSKRKGDAMLWQHVLRRLSAVGRICNTAFLAVRVCASAGGSKQMMSPLPLPADPSC
jgi:hypothetical protein